MVRFSLAMGGGTHIILLRQPRPQGPLGGQNGGLRVFKNIGDFDCLKLAAGFVIG